MIDRPNRATPSDMLALAKQARTLSLQLEQGQACTPCSDAFSRLIDGPYSRSTSLAFVCLSETSKNSVLSDLMALGMVTTEHEKFGIRGTIGESLVRVTYITELSHSLGAWQEFTEGGQILIIAGEHLVSEGTRSTSSMADLVKSFPVVLVWLTDEGVDTESGWWHHSMIQSHASKPTVHLRVQLSLERLIASNNQVLRSLSATIRESQSFGWLQSAIAAFTARTQRELLRIKEAQCKNDGPNRLLMAKPLNADKDLVKIKEAVASSLSRIDKDLTLKSERGTQPLGKWTGLVREIASSLVVADLEQTQTSSALKLSVNAGHLAKLNRRIEHAIRQELTVDVGTVNRQVEQVVNEHCYDADKPGSSLNGMFPVLKDQAIWQAVENMIAVGKVSEIELVRKGFFDVLTAGRQKVFIVIMFISLMGRMGLPNLFQSGGSQVAFGIFMAAIMIGSMINSILLWRREKKVQSERELSKIRESLFNDACKVIEQVEKVKLTAVREFLKEVAFKIETIAKQKGEESVSSQKTNLEEEQRNKELMKRGLETRAKMVIEIERQSAKIGELVQNRMQSNNVTLSKLLKDLPECFSVNNASSEDSKPKLPSPSTDKVLRKLTAEPAPTASSDATESRSIGLLERRRLKLEANRAANS